MNSYLSAQPEAPLNEESMALITSINMSPDLIKVAVKHKLITHSRQTTVGASDKVGGDNVWL